MSNKKERLEQVQSFFANNGLKTLGQLNDHASKVLGKTVDNFWLVSEAEAEILFQDMLIAAELEAELSANKEPNMITRKDLEMELSDLVEVKEMLEKDRDTKDVFPTSDSKRLSEVYKEIAELKSLLMESFVKAVKSGDFV